MKKALYIGLFLGALLVPHLACRQAASPQVHEHTLAAEIILEWHQLLLEMERHTPGYRPPVTARTWAFLNITAWQATLPGMPESAGLGVYVPGLPAPPRTTGAFCLPASLNAAYAESIRQFFPTAPRYLLDNVRELEEKLRADCQRQTDAATLRHSAAHGRQTALEVWRWSATDPFGHDGFLYNFDRNYLPPNGVGCWQPGGAHPMPALLPYWGQVRPLLVSKDDVPVRAPLPYDEKPGSPFHAQAVEIYTMANPLSNEHRWIAEFWSDDVPGLTVSPMGRWISIVNQAVAQADLPFAERLELYLKAALANADLLVICWDGKYRYNRERPETYINRVIAPDWTPLHDSPPFPAYPSGHAAIGAATAEVLSTFLGDHFSLTDRTHEGRTEFVGKPRSYGSFRDMAQENALSRLALGVHYRMDSEEGMRLGRLVGQHVAALPLRVGRAKISAATPATPPR